MKTRVIYTFDVVMFVIFAVMTVMALQFNPASRQIPLLFGTIGTCMMLLQLAYNFVPKSRNILKFIQYERSEENEPDSDKHAKLNYKREWSRALIGAVGMTCFVILISFIGYILAAPIFIFLIMKFAFKEGWRLSAVVSLVALLFIWLLFDVLLAFQV